MSGQEPGGRLNCGLKPSLVSSHRRSGLYPRASAFYLGSEVEVVPACLPAGAAGFALLGGQAWLLLLTQFSQQVAGRGWGGGRRPGGQVSSLRARLGQAPFSSTAPARLVGGSLWLRPDLDPYLCPPASAALPPAFVLPAQG